MAGAFTFERWLWGATFTLNAGLLLLLLARKLYRVFPFFFLYVLLDLLHGIIVLLTYRIWGFASVVSFAIAWGTQGLVMIARAVAVAEICRMVLAKYRGIWGLGWRIFVAVGILVLAYSMAVGAHSWRLATLSADRSLELAIAMAILALFVFIHYYRVAIAPAARFLATGFFLYSWFRVVNDTFLARWLTRYATVWNLLGAMAFLASLLLWMWAVAGLQSETTSAPELLPRGQYHSLSPQINRRLQSLNEQLGRFWRAQGEKT